jgi:hypothetical protein
MQKQKRMFSRNSWRQILLKKSAGASLALAIGASIFAPAASAFDVLIFSNEVNEQNANLTILDFDDTGGDITLQFGSTLGEQLFWDNANSRFVFTDDLEVRGEILSNSPDFTLDSDNVGAGANVNVIANQGSDLDGILRYNATTNQWELSNNGGPFSAIQTAGSTDADTLDGLDSAQFLRSDTSDNFTSGTLTFDAATTLDVDGTFNASGATNINLPFVDNNTLILDNDNTGGNVTLQFGNTLNETIAWDSANSRFLLSDDLRVDGNLEQNGNAFTIDADNAGAGANVDFVANQGSDLDGVLRYNATTNQWELSNDGGAFSKVQTEAEVGNRTYTNDFVVTDGQTVTASIDALDTEVGNQTYTNDFAVTDGQNLTQSIDAIDSTLGNRTYTNDNFVADGQTFTASINALDTALGESTKKIFVNMNDLTVQADGTSNNANLYFGSEAGANPHQYYNLKTNQASLQDLDLKIKIKLPEDFVDFSSTNDLSFFYKNTGTDNTDSKIDILIEDAGGDDAFLAANGQNLFNTAWTELTQEFTGVGFNPAAGDYIYVTIKMYASKDGVTFQQPFAGELVISYNGANK